MPIMGVDEVFSCLKEIFPQVDFRILRGVALEYENDLNAAVDDVMNAVLPILPDHPGSPVETQSHDAGEPTQVETPRMQILEWVEQKEDSWPSLQVAGNAASEDANNNDRADSTSASFDEASTVVDGTISSKTFLAALCSNLENAENTDQTDFTTAAFHDTNSAQNFLESSDVDEANELHEEESLNTGSRKPKTFGNVDVGLQPSSARLTISSINENEEVHECSLNEAYEWKDFDFSQRGSVAGSHFEGESSIVQVEPHFPEHVPETVLPKEDDSFYDLADNTKEVTTSSVCTIDSLEESIEDAKHNKKTLFSAMESVITLMRQVELQEKDVDRIREEAAKGGKDIMVKVDELKGMLAHAKDANDMHAGEVYGEKAILATEVRELQCRLLGLSDERDKSLAILEEMRGTLQARLSAIVELRKFVEDEKLENEESARKALAEQETIMEKVVEESKTLQQQAEENSKLQEFLMDRGRIVDMLRGEISVICQDVKLLKEKFDDRVPLSRSVSSSQTSCILASSGSSLERVGSIGSFRSAESLKMLERSSHADSVDGLSPKYRVENKTVEADKQAVTEDGWESSLVEQAQNGLYRVENENVKVDKQALIEDGWDLVD